MSLHGIPEHRLLEPPVSTNSPLIVCLHGSGTTPLPSWEPLLVLLSQHHRVLFYDRSLTNPGPEQSTSQLHAYLAEHDLKPPYVLVAHSYGGAFARCFLHRHNADIAGVVLVETGQEAAWDQRLESEQLRHCVLGRRPLSVVRGNSLLQKWKELEHDEQLAIGSEEGTVRNGLQQRRNVLEMWDAEDERLKKVQLRLSRSARYRVVPDCAHDVVRARPEIVLEEVRWVMGNLSAEQERGWWQRLVGLFSR